jgi:hypothetical protein
MGWEIGSVMGFRNGNREMKREEKKGNGRRKSGEGFGWRAGVYCCVPLC